MTMNLATILRESAARYPSNRAIVLGDTSLTYEALDGAARKFAAALAGLGVRRGTPVALMLPNVPQFTIAYFAAHYLGAPVVPLNVQLTPNEIVYHLADSHAVALVAWEGVFERAQLARSRVPACKALIVARATHDLTAPDGAHNMLALLATHEPVAEPAPTMPDDTAVVLFTSGTTGRPKGAELTHANLSLNADYCSSHLLSLTSETVGLAALPLFHSFGQTLLQNAVLQAGGTMIMMPRFDPGAAFGLMQKHRVNLFGGVPTMYFALLHHSKSDGYDMSSLKFCISGGSAMPVEVMKAFDEKYGVNILEGYGLSETSPVASFNVLDRPKKPGSIGLPIRGVEFRLVDDAGVTITAAMERGEICIKGHNVMKGYYLHPDATAGVMKEGWLSTGDIAYRDEDGYYFIVDRKKDMIIRGGFNVYPREIEDVLCAHPAIQEAAVIGVSHPRHGEEVKALLVLKPGQSASESELVTYCKENLAAYKCPRLVEFRESLPKTATGKVLKRELREEAAAAAL
ncbi:MAG: AMP-dependent synthetase and ligase [Myxococcaceae bacterium]|nr:AMP-dependent synthetase and ligase [Myxococcaceae bacterium]